MRDFLAQWVASGTGILSRRNHGRDVFVYNLPPKIDPPNLAVEKEAMRYVCPLLLIPYLVGGAFAEEPAKLAADEAKDGFELLFDGLELTGWKHGGNWAVEDGVITRRGKGGSLVYVDRVVPDNFELRFEWKVAEGSNSGVYYRPTQYEYQILDNDVHQDGKNPRTSAASLYFCMQPSHDATNPVGQWNTARIVCKGTVVQHWLNGKKVVGFDYTDPKYKSNVDMLNKRGGDLQARGANLSLQDHGDPVWYRNIRMRELTAESPIDMTEVTPQPLSEDVLEAERIKLEGIVKRREAATAKKKTKK